MRRISRYMFVVLAAALLYLGWTFADRYRSNREFERARARQFCAILNSASSLDLASQAE